jgi:hypothetical protein
VALGVLALVAFSILLGLNRHLRKEQMLLQPPSEGNSIVEAPTPPTVQGAL